jgi:hypothetical protein
MTTMLGFLTLPAWVPHPTWLELAGLFVLPYLYIALQQLRHHRQNQLFRAVSENAADMIAL